MRLWHYKLIPLLPRQQLLGQHRECCAMRGRGWGKKHSTVDYVFSHDYQCLFFYHLRIMEEMKARGYKISANWEDLNYRGKELGYENTSFVWSGDFYDYPEHNETYYQECLANLKAKGVVINGS